MFIKSYLIFYDFRVVKRKGAIFLLTEVHGNGSCRVLAHCSSCDL